MIKTLFQKGRRLLSPVLLLTTGYGYAQPGLEQGFRQPPDSVKPGVYWYWLNDNISPEGAQKDIAAMASIGIGHAFIGNIGLPKEEVPYGKVKLFSPGWWNTLGAALDAADKHKLNIGLFNSPGWSQSGGPWIKPTASMRYLSSLSFPAKGSDRLVKKLVLPKDFQLVAITAYRIPVRAINMAIYTDTIRVKSNKDTAIISLKTATAYPFNRLLLYPGDRPFKVNMDLQVAEGNGFKSLRKFEMDRSNPDKNVGFLPKAPLAISLPGVSGSNFRLLVSGSGKNFLLDSIVLGTEPVLERYMEKQLAKMFQTPLPLWQEYQWENQPERGKTIPDATAVRNITASMGKDSVLRWTAPAGDWQIDVWGMLPTGVMNAPATPEGHGLEMDKMNQRPIQAHFDAFVGKVQQQIPAEKRKALKWLVADSYETGSQNWTDGMTAAFKKQYGYDPLPWLPVLNGVVIGSADQSNRFLWDLRRLIADRVAYEYVGGLKKVGNKNGLKLWLENYGHWGFPGEFLLYGGQSDEVAGEFWNEGSLGNIENRAASSAAHTYGKRRVWSESYTAGAGAFKRYPALLKKRGDWSYTEGVNSSLLHVFIEQPYDSFPGVNAGFGTEFNRNNTWYGYAKPFVDYIRRCNFMLQQGLPVNDIAYFIGEDAPKMTGIRSPELPPGYQFDYINADVILNRLEVRNNRWTLPDGMSYGLLVLPPLETMRPAVLEKLLKGVKAGGKLLGPAPSRSPGLADYPQVDKAVRKLAAAIWSKEHAANVFGAEPMDFVLKKISLEADISFSSSNVLYTHRKLPETDIYFITNQTDSLIQFTANVRVDKALPEWWDATTGNSRPLSEWTSKEGRTALPLTLAAAESGFLVFKKGGQTKGGSGKNFPVADTVMRIAGPWKLQLDSNRRGPVRPLLLNTLTDLSLQPNDSVRYYSGPMHYRTSFSIATIAAAARYRINLGKITGLAKLTINGKAVGTVWTAPWELDVTGLLKEGENLLEIEVVNTWVNRLIGDAALPVQERKTWSNVNPYTKTSPLESSGLIGPVNLLVVPGSL